MRMDLPLPAEMPRFVADVHLGRLARALRMLGVDTLYENSFTNGQLVALASGQQRILLSRNEAFQRNAAVQVYVLHSEDYLVQLQSVVQAFGLLPSARPFTRCLRCNGALQPVSKQTIESLLEENTRRYYNAFWQCSGCGRIYWKGAHYHRMQRLIRELGER